MIELTVKEYLETVLDCPVFMEVPENPAPPFVIVQKTGSGRENQLDSAMIVVQSYDASLYKAALLNERVKEAMDALPDLPSVSGCYRNSDYPFPDTTKKRYRYQAVFDIYHY